MTWHDKLKPRLTGIFVWSVEDDDDDDEEEN